MSAFVDVEKWFAEAQSQRLALELLSNLAVVDAEEDESGSIRLQVGEVSTLLDTEGVIGQVSLSEFPHPSSRFLYDLQTRGTDFHREVWGSFVTRSRSCQVMPRSSPCPLSAMCGGVTKSFSLASWRAFSCMACSCVFWCHSSGSQHCLLMCRSFSVLFSFFMLCIQVFFSIHATLRPSSLSFTLYDSLYELWAGGKTPSSVSLLFCGRSFCRIRGRGCTVCAATTTAQYSVPRQLPHVGKPR